MKTPSWRPQGENFGLISIHGEAGPEAGRRKDFRTFGHYQAVLLWKGEGLYEDMNGMSTRLRAGDLILGFPNMGHRYGPGPKDDWHELFLVFDGPVFELLERAGLLRRDRPVWHLEPVAEWETRFREIVDACGPVWEKNKPIDPHLQLRNVCRLQQFLVDALATHTVRYIRQAERHWGRNATDTLEACRDAQSAARKLGLSYAHFRRRFVRTIGTSPGRYLAAKQIEEACRLIQQTNMPDYEIAARTGFSDPYHFSRRFKQMTSQTPRQYRRSLP